MQPLFFSFEYCHDQLPWISLRSSVGPFSNDQCMSLRTGAVRPGASGGVTGAAGATTGVAAGFALRNAHHERAPIMSSIGTSRYTALPAGLAAAILREAVSACRAHSAMAFALPILCST